MDKRYIVKDKKGAYQSAYNLHFGKEKAFDWAVQCAKTVKGTVYFVDDAAKTEVAVFTAEQ